jgi:RNA polymerase sigma-70 factor (ECF subfamily)
MDETQSDQELARRFEENRARLRGVAYRMLGSLSEADDAVQETWMRLSRAGASDVENFAGWLTTVTARICLDMLRSRESRREDDLETLDTFDARTTKPSSSGFGSPAPSAAIASRESGGDPEHEAMLADSVGLALLVVLDRLAPAERIAFVLHDMFDVPFDEIAPMGGRTPTAARQLASRARRRVRFGSIDGDADREVDGESEAHVDIDTIGDQRATVDAFLAALRAGDFEALLAVLDPELVVRADSSVVPGGAPREIRGASNWARQAVAFSQSIRFGQAALVDGAVGVVMAPRGRLFRVLRFVIEDSRIRELEIVGEASVLEGMDIKVLG